MLVGRKIISSHMFKSFFSSSKNMSTSAFSAIPLGPADPILGLNEAFQKDPSPDKVNLGVGAYRDDQGKPHVLHSVRIAEKAILDSNLNKEYLPIAGLPAFINQSLVFAYGDKSPAITQKKIAAIQTLSGTGGVRVAAEFIKRFNLSSDNAVYQPNPTWGNHVPICKDAGLEVKTYPYYNKANNSLDLEGWLATIQAAKTGSVFLVHACAHNPTGLDPTEEQWAKIAEALVRKNHLVLLDCAYQGFASGDAEKDAFAIRYFVENNVRMMLVQSYAKNFGLYGERVGCLSVVCENEDEAKRVLSQLKILVRPVYSNPPVNGARIVERILSDPELREMWRGECKEMADRIKLMRTKLVENLKEQGSEKDWGHVVSQIGMFCYTGLNKEQVERMISEFHIYMTSNGRISMAGVTTGNVAYIAKALHEVTKDPSKL